jgi:hypothetical protein
VAVGVAEAVGVGVGAGATPMGAVVVLIEAAGVAVAGAVGAGATPMGAVVVDDAGAPDPAVTGPLVASGACCVNPVCRSTTAFAEPVQVGVDAAAGVAGSERAAATRAAVQVHAAGMVRT